MLGNHTIFGGLIMHITRLSTIPRLAWVAYVQHRGETQAFVGEWVEAGDSWLLEGAWNGAFDATSILDSHSFMGSGLVEQASGAVAVAPCNTTEGIYSITDSDGAYVSNSIPLLLKTSGHSLDVNYLDYEADTLSVSKGLDSRAKHTQLANDARLNLHYYCNVRFTPEPVESRKALPPAPVDYDEYRRFLVEETQGIAANASDPARRVQYTPIVFCSNGYDSTACAVLGLEAGCDEAVVYESKRAHRTDSGAEVVASLGYSTIHERDEMEFKSVDAAELFLGTGELGTSIFFSSAANELRGKLLISGVHGDKMWDKDHAESGGPIVRSTYPDTAKTEFRLETGYINYPPAFLTATIQPDIHRISTAAEMEPWTLHNDYDRPIPRRLAEEAGVPREAFGMIKRGGAGSSLRFGNRSYLARSMPPESYRRFSAFLPTAKRRVSANSLTRSAIYLMFAFATLLHTRGLPQLGKLLKIDTWPTPYKCSPFAPALLFPWAVEELSKSYELPGDLRSLPEESLSR